MNQEVPIQLRCIKYYQTSGNLGITCQRRGISRPNLRKWLQRYEEFGLAGLAGKSPTLHDSPKQENLHRAGEQVLLLRQGNNIGARRIQNKLKRQYQLSLSLATIHKILVKNTEDVIETRGVGTFPPPSLIRLD